MSQYKRNNKQLLLMAAVILYDENKTNKSKERKYWVRPWLLRRNLFGYSQNLFKELMFEDPFSYRRMLRMDVNTFEELLTMLQPVIQKQDTNMRLSISAQERLEVTIRYLATGESQISLQGQFRIAQNTISKIVHEVCNAIYEVLQPIVLKVPQEENQWRAIADNFEKLWNVPNCWGAIDGKHIQIRPPKEAGSLYYNYKGTHSIVLMAIVDADYRFLYVNVGANGRISDGGVFDRCSIKRAITQNTLQLPPEEELPYTINKVPFVLLGDDAFPLTSYLMKPYSGRSLTQERRIFNYRLSRGRRVSENAFGILANKFQIFAKPIMSNPDRVKMIVLASCCLHNFLRNKNIENKNFDYINQGLVDQENLEQGLVVPGSWRNHKNNFIDLMPIIERQPNRAKEIREIMKEYFNTVGKVEWQDKFCLNH